MSEKSVVILGVGNVLQKDDGIGVYASAYLDANYIFTPTVKLINGGVEGINLLNTFLNNNQIIILDTLLIDDEPGTVYNIPTYELRDMTIHSGSAHEVGILECLDMIQLLGYELPHTNVIGIIPKDISLEIGLSDNLHVKFEQYIAAIIEHLNSCGIQLYLKEKRSSLKEIIEGFRDPSKTK